MDQSGQAHEDKGTSSGGNNQTTQLILQKPKVKIFYEEQDPSSLFYGYKWIGWDLEWHPITSKIYAAAFVNYKGEMLSLHIGDPDFNGDEGKSF